MNKQIAKMLTTEYEKRQTVSLNNYLNSKNALYSKIPEIEDIDFSIKKIGLNLNRSIVLGKEEEKSKFLDHMTRLKEEKNKILKSFNYPFENLQRKFICNICKDKGYINVGTRTKKCTCYEQLIISYIYEQSNLNLTEIENFDNFDQSLFCTKIINNDINKRKASPMENILSIKGNVMNFIKNFSSPFENNLYFTGPTGVGKTFMCSCIAYELINSGRTVLYQSAPILFDILNDHKFKNYKDKEYDSFKYSNIFNVELLIIDDLGTEFKSSSRYSDLLNVLNTRLSNNSKNNIRKTLISTNLNTRQLYEYYDERTASRIIGNFNFYKFFGEDLRKVRRRNSFTNSALRSS